MLSKNNLPLGLGLGLILPLIALLIFEVIIPNGYLLIQRGMPYFITVFLNLAVMRFLAAKKQDRTAMGVMLVTFVFMILVYFFRFR